MSDEPEKSVDHPETMAERRARIRHDWDNLIEDLIAEGQKQGVFDNLPGEGKPLKLKKNPYAPEMDLAHQLLKDNDLRPTWITLRNELLEQIRLLRLEIEHTWERHERE